MTNFQLTEQRKFYIEKFPRDNEAKAYYILIGDDTTLSYLVLLIEKYGLCYGHRGYKLTLIDNTNTDEHSVFVTPNGTEGKFNDSVSISYDPRESTFDLKLAENIKLYVDTKLLKDMSISCIS